MRTIIDIPDTRIQGLDALALQQSRSRAAVIRDAVEAHLRHHQAEPLTTGFGLWKSASEAEDGLIYQTRIREEW